MAFILAERTVTFSPLYTLPEEVNIDDGNFPP